MKPFVRNARALYCNVVSYTESKAFITLFVPMSLQILVFLWMCHGMYRTHCFVFHIVILLKLDKSLVSTQEHGFKNVVLQNILSAHEDVGKVPFRCVP